MKKLGKLFAALLVLGLTIVSCSSENEYYDEPTNPVAPGVENPIGNPSTPGHH